MSKLKQDLKNFIYITTMVENVGNKSLNQYETPKLLCSVLLLDKKARRLFYNLFIKETQDFISQEDKSKFGKKLVSNLTEIFENYDETDFQNYKNKLK